MPQISNDGDTPQTCIVKEFRPGDEGLMEAILAESTMVIRVVQGPIAAGPTKEYLILEGGKKRIADPMKESRPYRDVDWSLYINIVGEWTQLKGQKRIPWKDDAPHRLLKRMVTVHPRPVDRFDAGDVQGKMMVSEPRLRGLMTEMRNFVGNDVLPARHRSLSREATIVVERRG